MTIQDAIKSGRPFRRPRQIRDWPSLWLVTVNSTICIDGEKPAVPAHISTMDLLATDWEIKNILWPGEEFYLTPQSVVAGKCETAHIIELKEKNLDPKLVLIKVKIIEEKNV